MIKLNFCVNCGATPHYKKKDKHFCSVKCEKEYFNNKKKQNLDIPIRHYIPKS